MENFSFVCVDFQKEFTSPDGYFFRKRPMVDFVKKNLFPFLKKKNIKVSEIAADYRKPRRGDRKPHCAPGSDGFLSELPGELRKSRWVKAMNSPVWTRKNAGTLKKTSWPYVDDRKFTFWLKKNLRKNCILFGLTLDKCLLCTVQELYFRGYRVKILREGCDTFSGSQKEKEMIFNLLTLTKWAEIISWNALKKIYSCHHA